MKNCRNPNCCSGSPHFCIVFRCRECGKDCSGTDCKLCSNCQIRLKQCGHCRSDLQNRHKKKSS